MALYVRDRALRNTLAQDVIPFWVNHCVDEKYGGFFTCLDRDGKLSMTPPNICGCSGASSICSPNSLCAVPTRTTWKSPAAASIFSTASGAMKTTGTTSHSTAAARPSPPPTMCSATVSQRHGLGTALQGDARRTLRRSRARGYGHLHRAHQKRKPRRTLDKSMPDGRTTSASATT